jgi:hypothetical protein
VPEPPYHLAISPRLIRNRKLDGARAAAGDAGDRISQQPISGAVALPGRIPSRPQKPASRFIFTEGPHNAAVIEGRKTSELWTVDPWTLKGSEVPDIFPLEKWKAGD